MGYDAFGLPAENHAIKTASTPASPPRRRSRSSGASSTSGGSRSTGTASSAHTSPRTTAGPSGSSCACSRRARVSQGRRGQLVPEGRDRAGERAGDRRPLRALRHAGRGPPARAVVLQHHRLRRPPARRPPHDRVAGPRRDDAGELDRPLGGRRGRLPLRGARHRLPGVHHAPGHALRRDVLRHGARAPGCPEAERLARGARLHRARGERVAGGARRRGQGEVRVLPRPHPSRTPSTASRSRCSSRTTC